MLVLRPLETDSTTRCDAMAVMLQENPVGRMPKNLLHVHTGGMACSIGRLKFRWCRWNWSGGFAMAAKEAYFGLRIRHADDPSQAVNIPVNSTVGPSGAVQRGARSCLGNSTPNPTGHLRMVCRAKGSRALGFGPHVSPEDHAQAHILLLPA